VVSHCSDKTLRVWNVETGSCERVLEGRGLEGEAIPEIRSQSPSQDSNAPLLYLDGFVPDPDLILHLPLCQVIAKGSQLLILRKIALGDADAGAAKGPGRTPLTDLPGIVPTVSEEDELPRETTVLDSLCRRWAACPFLLFPSAMALAALALRSRRIAPES
jgi:hypothetical protein